MAKRMMTTVTTMNMMKRMIQVLKKKSDGFASLALKIAN